MSRGSTLSLLLIVVSAVALSQAFVSPLSSVYKPATSTQPGQLPHRTVTWLSAGRASRDWALIFDCDGVILESESLHREAYNTVFREFEIDYRWDEEYYDQLQNKVGGGIPKMRYFFGENGWPTSTLGAAPTEEKGRKDMLNALQNRKTDIYKDMIRGGTAQVRPGVLRLIEEARRLGEDRPKLAICSASTKSSCLFVLDNLLKPDVLQHFDLILAGDDVKHRKPDPEIYRLASERLAIPASRSVVIEDSLIGLQAALGAQMPCVITHTASTKAQDFSQARAVFSELGDGNHVQVTARELMEIALGTPL
ncbi:hypothetical protein NGA_0345402 [Nannochloropsis gaditana CCMP526]|uniref:Haloacid dehalogenase-like hydrolase n=1 Tax=Nannochloropsis gaditana TaxID=72520 RepID=W7T531_9STRA|nr:hypothetical protein NGA_0345402 [Nannochloropsis gaditana CCMP526]EKU22508.1 hypothetical protein NGA_0345402 [Nannochloropsis gaditana CCMP526]EWM21647.1 Haloacid dehalogenase-like hydrolase [Nannochloropsis gaditana]|eukprot:XP_005853850.1 hypothetical protein NGA_0345402 [Nannochloropsis gaditana CCMP526]